MTLALEFSDTFDLTAIGTLVLAAVTLAALAVAAVSLRQTRKEIELSRTEVEEAHRPVIVPVADYNRFVQRAHRQPVAARPYLLPDERRLIIPVQNIGSGPALRIEASLRLLNPAGGWTGATGGEQTPGTTTGIGVAEMVPLEIEASRLSEVPGFELTVEYEDVARKRWVTVGRWIPAQDGYEDVTIERVKT